ncbi:hypothetical protein D6827_00940, partial [Candidatus Parcubacteria bacterium]
MRIKFGTTKQVGELFDSDHDTGIYVEKTTDDDIVRVDVGGAIVFEDIILLDRNNGFVWNEDGNDIDVRFETNNDEKIIFIDGANDTINFGTKNTGYTFNGAKVIPKVQIMNGEGNTNIDFIIRAASETAALGAFLIWARSRGSDGAETIVQSGDRIGVFRADAYDGSEFLTIGSIEFHAIGTPAVGSIEG